MIPTEWYVKNALIKRENWNALANGESEFVISNSLDYSCVYRCLYDGDQLGYMMVGNEILISAKSKKSVIETLRHLLKDSSRFYTEMDKYIKLTDGVYQACIFQVRCVAETFDQLIAMDDGGENW